VTRAELRFLAVFPLQFIPDRDQQLLVALLRVLVQSRDESLCEGVDVSPENEVGLLSPLTYDIAPVACEAICVSALCMGEIVSVCQLFSLKARRLTV
jgi:hypothetical protein